MFGRALKVAKLLALLAAVMAVTWMISWLGQYLCSIMIQGQTFHPTSVAANRLAFITLGIALGAIVVVEILSNFDECCMLVGIWLLFGTGVLAGLVTAADWAFDGTTVATRPAQIVYGIAAFIWGVALGYVFFGSSEQDTAKH